MAREFGCVALPLHPALTRKASAGLPGGAFSFLGSREGGKMEGKPQFLYARERAFREVRQKRGRMQRHNGLIKRWRIWISTHCSSHPMYFPYFL